MARRERTRSSWRWLLAAASLLGIGYAALRYPAVPDEPWPEPQAYRPDQALCETARAARQWTFFAAPSSPEPVTAAEVARRFNLEGGPVCRANAVADCEATRIEPARRLVLPLSADAPVVAAAREALRGDGG